MAPEGGSCVRLVSEAEIRSDKESWLTDRGSLRMFSGGGEGILAYV